MFTAEVMSRSRRPASAPIVSSDDAELPGVIQGGAAAETGTVACGLPALPPEPQSRHRLGQAVAAEAVAAEAVQEVVESKPQRRALKGKVAPNLHKVAPNLYKMGKF